MPADVIIGGNVGELRSATSSNPAVRQGAYAEAIVNDVGLGRYFEATRLGRVFHATNTAVACNNATFTIPLASTSTPVLGLSNPPGGSKAFVILAATVDINPAAATALATPMWAIATPNTGITAAAANTTITSGRTDVAFVTTARGFSNVAMTGLSAAGALPLTLRPFWSSAAPNNTALLVTSWAEETAGSIVLVPGSFLAILFSATMAAAGTVQAGITYAEIDWPLS